MLDASLGGFGAAFVTVLAFVLILAIGLGENNSLIGSGLADGFAETVATGRRLGRAKRDGGTIADCRGLSVKSIELQADGGVVRFSLLEIELGVFKSRCGIRRKLTKNVLDFFVVQSGLVHKILRGSYLLFGIENFTQNNFFFNNNWRIKT